MEEWITQHQALVVILASVSSSIVTALCTWALAKGPQSTSNDLLRNQLRQASQDRETLQKEKEKLIGKSKSAETELSDLKKAAKKLSDVRAKLQESSVVKTYRQPVVLVGPLKVGKTSLLMQWHAPWVTAPLERTHRHKTGEVPVYDFVEEDNEPHFADPEILVPVHTHLVLKVHDFPGEVDEQKKIRSIILKETRDFSVQSQKNLGIVLVCMFDAEEAKTGVSKETHQYYNGELFRELRTLVSHSQIHLERLILVFNKYDKLRNHFPESVDDKELLKLCIEKFDPIYDPLHSACNPERVCEVFTILSREDMSLNNRGAPIVLGESARAFVRAFAGKEAEQKIIVEPATAYAAERFL